MTRWTRPVGAMAILAFCLVCIAHPSQAQPTPAPAPVQGPQKGWTQIDIFKKGVNPGKPYTRDTRTHDITLYVKNPQGKFVAKTITVTMTKGKSFNQMAEDLFNQLKECIDEGWQFSASFHSNGVTVWPIDYGQDPDKEGKPNIGPDNDKNKVKVRKESHPVE